MRLLSVDAAVLGRDRGHDRAALAGLIEAAGADVACVHHGPHLLRWRSITAAVGRRAGMVVVGGGRPAGANVLFSTLGVDDLGSVDVALPGGSRGIPNGGVLARLRLDGREFVLGAATLLGNSAARQIQLRAVHDAVVGIAASESGPVPVALSVLGADRPGTAAWQALLAGRSAAGNRLFADTALAMGDAHPLAGYESLRVPPVVVDLTLPT